MQGHFELNVFVPLMARNLLQSIKLLASASRLLAEKCVDGIEANREQCERYAELTLSAATALNPYIGYDKATRDRQEGGSVRPLAARGRARGRASTDEVLDEALDYRAMARPHGLASVVRRGDAGRRAAFAAHVTIGPLSARLPEDHPATARRSA